MRKIIQIVFKPEEKLDPVEYRGFTTNYLMTGNLIALCDDGTLWKLFEPQFGDPYWEKIKLPASIKKEKTEVQE